MYHNKILQASLNQLENQSLLRNLEVYDSKNIDFFSNDYLGFSRSQELYELILNQLKKHQVLLGSTGSRLISGHSILFQKLEKKIANFHKAEEGLIFNSGYNANLSLLSSVPQKGDIILYDKLCHASIREGIQLSFAKSFAFQHNDIEDLERKIQKFHHSRAIYLIIEALYSMDGTIPPLAKIVQRLKKYKNTFIIIDEAHSTGIIGNKGEGLVASLNLEKFIFARVHTFGKAIGHYGGIVLGSKLLKNFLINKAKPFIYTTALSTLNLICIDHAYTYLKKNNEYINKLNENIKFFNSMTMNLKKTSFLNSNSPIQAYIVKGNKEAVHLAKRIKAKKINIKAILSPTVPKGTERLRICLHAFNTKKEIKLLLDVIGGSESS